MGFADAGAHAADPVLTRLVKEDTVAWYKRPNLRIMYVWLFLCCMGVEMTSGFDSQLINTLQNADSFNKFFGNGYKKANGNPGIEPSMLGFIGSSYQLGSIFAVPIAPWLNQRYGRRFSIMLGSIIMVVGALIQGFAQHVAMYVIARMLLGVGILFAIISGSSLIGELAHPKERAILTSFFNSSYFVGAIVSAAITIRTTEMLDDWAWRLPSLLQICPSLLQLCTVYLLPESPRYLVSRDREDEAYAILVKYHAEGNPNSLLVQAEMAQIRSTIKLEMENSKQSWMEMLSTAGLRRRFFISAFLGLFTQMSGNTLISYYSGLIFEMMGYTTAYVKNRINIANLCLQFFTANLTALYVTRFRRRWMFMLSSITMCACFTAMTVAFEKLSEAKDAKTTNSAAGVAALFFFFAYAPCYNIGNNALTYTYLLELWPYASRTRGIGIEQIFGKGGGFFSTNVNPLAMDALGWKFFAIYCGWIFFELIIQFFFYPETYGRTLEELAFLFEDASLNEKTVAAVQKQIGAGPEPTTAGA